jgi:hypothetical protein
VLQLYMYSFAVLFLVSAVIHVLIGVVIHVAISNITQLFLTCVALCVLCTYCIML